MKVRSTMTVVPTLVACLTGCAATATAPAEQAARHFYLAVESGQGQRACSLLTPEAAESLSTGGQTCATAVLGLDLPGGRARDAQIWGDEAQVRLTGDTVFLHHFPQGWLVRGAGCRPRGERPYRCEVES
ncbi:hypothetical protein AB0K21_23200 [Streptosporangium sp. NPDC049248]|uniref:hypothetical protein n=1 Tax=Streptosporangium sp. NPDC049248 TaxID=3155651 RepID=UPI00341B8BC7